ncbi:carboxymuconolactone decarboxylase family protein [Micromonosporaceae bacterium Da 78-11]
MTSLFARTARRLSMGHVRRVRPVLPSAATGIVATVYRRMESEFGMIAPPVALHAAAPEVLAAVWLMLRETLIAGDPADRAAKEAVAAAVSLANECPYCVQVHSAALIGIGGGADAERIAAGRLDDLGPSRLRDLARWARDSGVRPTAGRSPAPFGPDRMPALIGVAVTFHLINRMVNLFLGDTPLAPIPPRGRRLGKAVAVRVFGHFARIGRAPGSGDDLLPAAAPIADLDWASDRPEMADAMNRAVAAIERAASGVVPEPVRDLVRAGLADPALTAPGLAAEPWLAGQLAALEPAHRPAGRLALLTAWAAYRVTDADIERFRAAGHDDADLITVTAWAALSAAREIGQRLHQDFLSMSLPTERKL